jgi:hypothetical protein
MTCYVKIFFETVSLQDKKKRFQMKLKVVYNNEPLREAIPDIRYYFLPYHARVSLKPFEE